MNFDRVFKFQIRTTPRPPPAGRILAFACCRALLVLVPQHHRRHHRTTDRSDACRTRQEVLLDVCTEDTGSSTPPQLLASRRQNIQPVRQMARILLVEPEHTVKGPTCKRLRLRRVGSSYSPTIQVLQAYMQPPTATETTISSCHTGYLLDHSKRRRISCVLAALSLCLDLMQPPRGARVAARP